MMNSRINRRSFLKTAGITAAGTLAMSPSGLRAARKNPDPLFKLSLAEWSFHKALFAGKMDHLDFAKVARREFDIPVVEYVNQFFKDKATDGNYLKEMRRRADGEGVRNHLIMIDGEGAIGDADPTKQKQTIENHQKWVIAAKYLGCKSIRVNAATGNQGSPEDKMKRAAEGLQSLCEFARGYLINVIVENHGGLSSNGAWLVGVMKQVNLPNRGTLPDFGNFEVQGKQEYDRYKGVAEMMPFAKAVSAKSYDFDDQGNETRIDYLRMMKIVVDAGYHSFVGIEYEGSKLSEKEGVAATKKLLERVRDALS